MSDAIFVSYEDDPQLSVSTFLGWSSLAFGSQIHGKALARCVVCARDLHCCIRPLTPTPSTKLQIAASLKWGGDSSGGGPYIYQGDDNQLTGFEFELAQYLADKLGVKSEYVNWEWEMLPEILDRGTIDVVLNGYEWSEEREQLWSSTIPYYIYKLELMARSDDGSLAAWDDLAAKPGQPRKRVGVLAGSAAARYMEERFGDAIELKKYPEVTSVMGLVEQGQLDATVQDVPIAIFYGKDFPKLHAVGEPQAPGYYVAYVRHGDEALRARLNDAIRAAIDDGTLRRIYEKYGIWNDAQSELGGREHWPLDRSRPPRGAGRTSAITSGLLLRRALVTVVLSFLSMPLAMALGLLVAIGRLYGPRLARVAARRLRRADPRHAADAPALRALLPAAAGMGCSSRVWAGIAGWRSTTRPTRPRSTAPGCRPSRAARWRPRWRWACRGGMALRRVIIPQAVRIVIPPVTNDFIALFKDTSVCSVIPWSS